MIRCLILLTILSSLSTVLPASEDLRPEEKWTYKVLLPEDLWPPKKNKKNKKYPQHRLQKPILVWVPQGVKQIRATLIIPENSDSKHFGEHKPLRKILAKHQVGVIYVHPWFERGLDGIQPFMDHIAKETDIQEFKHCPWIVFGKSSRGKFPIYLSWKWPQRVIATISYHAETPTWPMEE